MSDRGANSPRSPEEVYAVVIAELRSRGAEVVRAIDASIPAIGSGIVEDAGAEYQAGRVAAIAATVAYSLEAMERAGEWAPIPQALAEQAHRMARIGVRPGALVRRYMAGHGRFMDFIREEIKRRGQGDDEGVLEHLRITYGALVEHIITSMECEYEQEREMLDRSPKRRHTKLIQRLLVEDVEPAELRGLGYEVLSGWHIGVIAFDAEGAEALRCLQLTTGQKLLSMPGDDETVLAWIGDKDKLTVTRFKRLLCVNGHPNPPLAIGEPGKGLQGWRQTYEEAQVALLIARQEPYGLTRCADTLPVVAALQNKALIEMYRKAYILPLNKLPKGGQPVRRSLLAYFKHGRSPSSAGNAIGVTRRTIENHLNDARKVLDAPLNMTGLEIALRLEELGYGRSGRPT